MVRVVHFRLKYLEVTDFEATWSKRYLKVHGDGWPRPLLALVRRVEQLDLGAELPLLHAAHALHLPHNGVLASLVLGLAFHADDLHARGVERGRDTDLNFLRQQRGLEVGLDHDLDLHLLLAPNLAHQRDHAERQADVLGGAVPHELKLAIRWDEADAVLCLKLAQLDTLVELAVVDGDGRLAPSAATC